MSRSQALNKLLFVIGILFFLCVAIQSPASTLHHQMKVELLPGLKMLKAENTITFPAGAPRKSSFLLHKDLTVTVLSKDDKVVLLQRHTPGELFSEYGLELSNQDHKVTLHYQGVIHDPVVNDSSRGLISPQGVALFGESYWYPVFLGQLKKFNLSVQTPEAWRALVQGQMTSSSLQQDKRLFEFTEIYPQQEIDLVAAEFKVYEAEMKNGPHLRVLLRTENAQLAQNFLKAVPDYITHYSQEIGPYPYSTFSVVENFWETGYGLPGFTLLGPSVIRLPFIFTSSLPHEVLHNWWGNSVYVNDDQGNWAEGLTTYMADHWQQKLVQADREYRLNALIRFDDFVTQTPERDFPLRLFRGRHNESSQAVGYSKSMMIFRMLEFRFGPDLFQKALRDFYRENSFKKASFIDLQKIFERTTRQDLSGFFNQWLNRKGAPKISLQNNPVTRNGNLYQIQYRLSQEANEKYDLVLPLTWTLEDGSQLQQVARLTDWQQGFTFTHPLRPVRLSVDSEYNVFRKLYLEERPVTLSTVLGSPHVSFYLSRQDKEAQGFALKWGQSIEGSSRVLGAEELIQPPATGAIVLIGELPEFRQFMADNLEGQEFQFSTTDVHVQGQSFAWKDVSTVIVTRLKSNPQQPIVWVRWSADNNPQEWASRLLHYGTFGILVFKERPVVFRSVWPVLSSPLIRAL